MLESKFRIKSGLIAVVLGLATTFSPLGVPFSSEENFAVAQTAGQPAPHPGVNPAYVAAQPVPDQHYAFREQQLLEARKALAVKDIPTADRLAREAKAMNLAYRPQDDQPDYVLGLIHQLRQIAEVGRTNGATDQYRRSYAALSLQQADGLLRRGELELATQLTQEAVAQNVTYNHADIQNGLEPQTMLRRIDDVRRARNAVNTVARQPMEQPQHQFSQATQEQLNQAVSMLAQARTALNTGQLEYAEQICRDVARMNLPESVFPQGSDSPGRLLNEVSLRRQAQPVTSNVQPLNVAPAVYQPPLDTTQTVLVRDEGSAAPLVAANTALVDQARRSQQMVLQQVASEIMQMISNADKMNREKRDPDAALAILDQARARVESAPLDPQAKAAFLRDVDRAVANTNAYSSRHQAVFDQDEINRQVLEDIRLSQEARLSTQEKLKTYVAECNRLLDERRYDEAMIVAKKARDLAPDEPAANMLMTMTHLVANIRLSQQIEEDKQRANLGAWNEVHIASIPGDFRHSSVIYKEGWRALRERRQGYDDVMNSRRPASEQEIYRRLEMPVSLNLERPMPLGYVLKMLSGQTGVEIFVDYPALREVDVTTETPVSIQLMKEIRLKSVLNLVLEQLGLTYIVKHEMLNVTSISKAKGQYYPHTYYVGDLIMGIPNFDGSSPVDFGNAMDRGMRQAAASAAANLRNRNGMVTASNVMIDPNLAASATNPNATAQMGSGASTSFSPGYGNMPFPMQGAQTGAGGGGADFGQIIELIQAVVAPDTWDEGSPDGGSMMEYYPNLSLVIRQTEEVHAEIAELLNQLRKLNDLQITVEVRFITLSDSFYENLGLDFNAIIRNKGAFGRVESGSLNTDNNANDDGTVDLSSQTVTGGRNVIVGLTGPMNIRGDLSIPFTQQNAVIPQFGGYQAGAGLNMGFALLSDIEAYFFLQAAQGDARSNLLQAPRVTIFNGQMGSISDVSMTPFVTSVIPVVGDFAAAYQPIIVILNEGQYMTVQGTVSGNRQYVRLTLNPVFSKITKVSTYRFVGEDSASEETESTSRGDDAATAADPRATRRNVSRSSSGVSIQLPVLASLSVSTTVSVPDGGTILLGGIKRLSEARQETGTPILNKIPYINRLFMNTAIGRDTSSVMMMVTPRIVIQEEEEEFILGRAL